MIVIVFILLNYMLHMMTRSTRDKKSPIAEVISKVDSRLFQDEDNKMLNVLLFFSAGFGNQDIGQVI